MTGNTQVQANRHVNALDIVIAMCPYPKQCVRARVLSDTGVYCQMYLQARVRCLARRLEVSARGNGSRPCMRDANDDIGNAGGAEKISNNISINGKGMWVKMCEERRQLDTC